MNSRRDIPVPRVAAFIRHYMEVNRADLTQFAFEARVGSRQVYRILNDESVNVKFEWVDNMLVSLDREYLWHWSPEDGGFADYYGDEPAPAAEKSVEQQRKLAMVAAKRHARRHGTSWLSVLHERAEEEMAA